MQDYTDFAYYRLDIGGVYYIGGFGVMGWVSVKDYAVAEPDPLADVAPGIIQHLNADHGAALRRIAGGVSPARCPDESLITAVDRLGFHLRLRTGER